MKSILPCGLRGSNENMNGQLRQYVAKRTDLSVHDPGDLKAVEERLNNRPRRILNWATLAQVFDPGLVS